MTVPTLEAAQAAGDLDELVRGVDRLVDAADWEALVELARRCGGAFERTGHQLWPIVSQVEYRLALEAPAAFAASVLVEGAGRFAFGPLSEVAACSHTWTELSPHLAPGPVAGLVGHERAVRGDRDVEPMPGTEVLDLPLSLEPWEPAYAVATYRPGKADFPFPWWPDMHRRHLPSATRPVEEPEGTAALAALAERWVVESNGVVDVVAVRDSAEAALATLGGGQDVLVAELEPETALAAMAWAGASGGAHGRRRGAAAGRFGAWWALAALAGLSQEWPIPPDELGEAARELRWLAWAPIDAPAGGWSLHLAVEDPDDGLAWALGAVDFRRR